MLVTNLVDNYITVPTLKLLIAFEYISQECLNVKYLVKTDDDIYLHIPKLERAIAGQSNKNKVFKTNKFHFSKGSIGIFKVQTHADNALKRQ